MQGSLNQYLLRIIIFLTLIVFVTIYLYPVLISAFLSNIYINSVILLSLFFGIIFCIYQVNLLRDSYSVLANFNIHRSPQTLQNTAGIIKNLFMNLQKRMEDINLSHLELIKYLNQLI